MALQPDRLAAVANAATYDAKGAKAYPSGAPHLKHATLRSLYAGLVNRVFDVARSRTAVPAVLDLGAGEGTATLPFLERGARVTAVDISSGQLAVLQERCSGFADRLEGRCQEVSEALKSTDESYDIVVANSFLHHIPDYLGLIIGATRLLGPSGQFFSFQDPMRYDQLTATSAWFSNLAYFSWRLSRGDVVGGIARRMRRHRGVYLPHSTHDNAEYHVTRNGVDQDAIAAELEALEFDCEVIRYFSTQSGPFQSLGESLGFENTFSVVACRKEVRGKV